MEECTRDTKGGILEEVICNVVVSISNQNEECVLSREIREKEFVAKQEKEESKKNNGKDIHPEVLIMILITSALNSKSKPDNLPDSFKAFFNHKSAGQADKELKLQFKNLDMEDIYISYSLVQALFAGKLTYPAMGSPCNLLPSVSVKETPPPTTLMTTEDW